METMELVVHRTKNAAKACTGFLVVDGFQDAYTLEDVVRQLGPNGEGKIWGQTAIPEGRYRLQFLFWAKFGKNYLNVMKVPFFTGIMVHAGVDDTNTEGCLLVGTEHDGDDHIHGGMVYLPTLNARVKAAMDAGKEVWITYRNEFPEPLQ